MNYDERMQKPHDYAPNCNTAYPGTCWGCGKSKDDPIHSTPTGATMSTYDNWKTDPDFGVSYRELTRLEAEAQRDEARLEDKLGELIDLFDELACEFGRERIRARMIATIEKAALPRRPAA